jgi:hypothetical protein
MGAGAGVGDIMLLAIAYARGKVAGVDHFLDFGGELILQRWNRGQVSRGYLQRKRTNKENYYDNWFHKVSFAAGIGFKSHKVSVISHIKFIFWIPACAGMTKVGTDDSPQSVT